MKIFITGVAGFLGSHLADRFLELGHTVAGVDNLIGGFRRNVDPEVKFTKADCRDQDLMKFLIDDSDVVVHAAATAHEGLSVFSPSFITKNIYEASVSVTSAAIAAGVKRFVFCSSMARYGNQGLPRDSGCHIEFREYMKPMPVDPYGIAKVAAEQTLRMLAETHGMEWNIAVPHNIVGERQRYDDPYRNVLSIMANRILSGKQPIVYGDGEQMRCFSYVGDCVECLEKMALDPLITSQIINIGPDENPITINEAVKLVNAACETNLEPIHMKDRPAEVKIATCNSDKARELLGYETKTTVAEAVDKTVNYIKENGPRPFDYNYNLEIINDLTPETWKDRLM
jgi:UDP-glucose 4-epimerase